MSQAGSPEAVLDFWFGQPGPAAEVAARQSPLWFGKSAANDQQVTERFADTLIAAGAGRLDHWARTPRNLLALIVVLDQFPHHIHRNQGQSFAYDAQSLALALVMIQHGDATRVVPIERVFVYLPLEHAESLVLQDQSVALYTQLAAEAGAAERPLFDGFLDYAAKHRDVVARFGRFPHRNELLGRPSSNEEIAFLLQPGSRF
ncbi:MAG TPA: DUF924 family protein [Thiobacillus sp.]|nr:MAG: hypothetical protein B7Y50_02805 [Hydrogenophilales bacterium 28-61-11]OYZ57868.1 MAG: hypothetical protein B7Y21_05670 [Hydrogenophilales bacterium 16-61-112]OZA46127.1 MAG: hypothetical protein B7X81_07440 [Hydrogenophilales bacterium 17-61-76]HQT31051.1 DUF924 family protein [Thiobacillus sp.]HQT69151.1 DUF924 family protein [Thiobacillus sp.]